MLISLRLTTADTEKMFFDYSKCEIQRPEKIQKQIYYSSCAIKTSTEHSAYLCALGGSIFFDLKSMFCKEKYHSRSPHNEFLIILSIDVYCNNKLLMKETMRE
jgi:hypothetical protein